MNELIVLAVFAVIGYFAGKAIPKPKNTASRIVYVVGIILLVLAGYVGVSTRVLSVLGFDVMLNWLLQGLLLGILIRFAIERR